MVGFIVPHEKDDNYRFAIRSKCAIGNTANDEISLLTFRSNDTHQVQCAQNQLFGNCKYKHKIHVTLSHSHSLKQYLLVIAICQNQLNWHVAQQHILQQRRLLQQQTIPTAASPWSSKTWFVKRASLHSSYSRRLQIQPANHQTRKSWVTPEALATAAVARQRHHPTTQHRLPLRRLHQHPLDRGQRVRIANTSWGWKRRVARFIIRRRQHPQRIATIPSNHTTAMNQD